MASDVLVSTDWVAKQLDDSKVKLVEVDVDTTAYEEGHAPGAIAFNWTSQLQDQVRRDIISKEALEQLLSNAGIGNDDTIVLYGDNNNWFAAYGFWLFKIYGHKEVRLMNGGRVKWLNEKDKPMTTDVPKVTPTAYKASGPNRRTEGRGLSGGWPNDEPLARLRREPYNEAQNDDTNCEGLHIPHVPLSEQRLLRRGSSG